MASSKGPKRLSSALGCIVDVAFLLLPPRFPLVRAIVKLMFWCRDVEKRFSLK